MRLRRNILQALAITAALVGGTFGAEPNSPTADLSFTFDYFSRAVETLEPTANFVFSPISAERVVCALALGAEDQTKSEIISALRKDKNVDAQLDQTSALYQKLREAPETSTFGGLWIREKVARPQTEFLARLVNAKLVDVVSFEDFAAPDARDRINRTLAEKTTGQISEFFKSDDFRIDGSLILADVVSFEGEWVSPFDPESTKERNFVDANGVKTPTPQMRASGRCLYSETEDGQYVEIPYQGGRFSFAAYLPRADVKYSDFESTLTSEKFLSARQKAVETEIELYVPKFAVSAKFELSATLKKLGVVRAFGDSAQLKGIDKDEDLKLDEIRQGLFLTVDEKGSKASAATSGVLVPKSLPFITCDLSRPFVYAIRENSSGALLFLGRLVSVESVVKPESSSEDSK